VSAVDVGARDLLTPVAARETGVGVGWILRRLAFGVITLWLITILVFVATQALPSDPARAILGRAPPSAIEGLRHQLGLDRPLLSQYTHWLSGVLQGDFGQSYSAHEPVTKLTGGALSNSLLLLALVAIIAIPGGIALGFIAAVRRNSVVDRALLGGSLLFTALPEFVVALLLVILFSTTVLTLLPAVTEISAGASPLSKPNELVLPVATLVFASVPYVFRQARASMTDTLESDFIEMARLKGMPERRVIWRHAAPNALIAPVQASALVLAYLLGGIVVVEEIFSYPGLGTTLVQAVSVRDLPTIQAVVLVFAAGVVLFNLLADVLTVLLTPKLRTPAQ
jgi:peptide/nickel transport system permease protein